MSKELFVKLAKDRPEHSDFPPSSADKWLNCYGYYVATKDIPWTPSGKAAIRGTEAHALLEKAILTNNKVEDLTEDEELIRWVGHALDYVSSYKVLTPTAEIYPEVYLPWFGVSGGTVDILGISDKEILIADLKTGVKQVEVEDNSQLFLYALAIRFHVGKRDIYRLTILQPNGYHQKGPVREFLVNNADLDAFEDKAKKAITHNLLGGLRTPGKHCKWCKAEAVCKERAQYMLKKVSLDFGELL